MISLAEPKDPDKVNYENQFDVICMYLQNITTRTLHTKHNKKQFLILDD